MKFEKLQSNPILTPNPMNLWEAKYVFNPGVIYDGELFHMLYRAQGPDMVSRLGYAVSKDGINFNRMTKPVFEPENMDEVYGVEDARITFIDGKYHVCYTAFSPSDIKASLATTTNFISWKREGVIFNGHEKDAVLLSEKINGKYVMYHSVDPDIYVSCSKDKIKWEKPIKVASPRINSWDDSSVGVSGVPIKTKYGWLILYHGVQAGIKPIYRLGFMLADLENPAKILKRSSSHVLEPELPWEIAGGIPHVVFSTSFLEVGDKYYTYYGGADSAIGLATIEKKEVEKWLNKKD